MIKYTIELSYNGTEFCGWQPQRGIGDKQNLKPSIEEKVAAAIHGLWAQSPTIVSSGRTDAGVHACGQVAHFTLQKQPLNEANLLRGLNHLLPDSIRVIQIGRVPIDFRANYSAKKQYSYYFQCGPTHLPHLSNYSLWNRYPLDGDLMSEALEHLVGEHDFVSFCSANAQVSTTVRTLFEADIIRRAVSHPGCFDPAVHYLWQMRLVGSGFLKQMVRSIAGTIKQIGEQRRPPTHIKTLLESHLRDQAGPTAPASGLWLDRVWYPQQMGIDHLHQCPPIEP